MNNKDFIAEVAAISKMKEDETLTCCGGILKTLETTLMEGEEVRIHGFGCFGVDKILEHIDIQEGKRMLFPPQLTVFYTAEGNESSEMGRTASEGFINRLAARLGCSADDAEILTFAFFKAIVNGLAKDRTVKVKGLGQFKVNASKPKDKAKDKDKDSQLFLAEALGSVSFSIDNALKTAVNKPFEQFKPVVLADGVVFDDLKEGEIISERISGTLENDTILPPQRKEEKNNDTKPESTPEVVSDVVVNEAVAQQVEPAEEKETKEDGASDASEQPAKEKDGKMKWFFVAAGILALAVVLLFALMPKGSTEPEMAVTPSDVPADSSAAVTVQAPQENFDEANELVKFGAYKIVGVDTTIMLQQGQTILTLSSTYFGGVEMEPYIKAVNGGKNDFVAGDYVKIPKLVLK